MRLAHALVVVLLAGCPADDGPNGGARRGGEPSKGAPLNLSKPDEVRVRTDLALVRGALTLYKEENGAFPASLDELGLELHFPDDLRYDPTQGRVKSRAYPQF